MRGTEKTHGTRTHELQVTSITFPIQLALDRWLSRRCAAVVRRADGVTWPAGAGQRLQSGAAAGEMFPLCLAQHGPATARLPAKQTTTKWEIFC